MSAPWKFFCTGLLLSALLACATAPPVQEMSDARQAIAAAREAGAAIYAASQLQQAETRLRAAEQYLSAGDNSANWSFARRDALAAKDIALEALLRSREARAAEDANAQ